MLDKWKDEGNEESRFTVNGGNKQCESGDVEACTCSLTCNVCNQKISFSEKSGHDLRRHMKNCDNNFGGNRCEKCHHPFSDADYNTNVHIEVFVEVEIQKKTTKF